MAKLDREEWWRYCADHELHTTSRFTIDAFDPLAACTERAIATIKSGNKILFAGNGGSYSMACHLAAELMGRFEKDRRALPGIALGANGAELTAIANDYNFANIYSRALNGLGRPGDMVILLSTSGTSPNIRSLAMTCRERDFAYSLWTSSRFKLDGKPYPNGVLLRSPSENTAIAQVHHLIMGHYMCKKIEEACV